MEYKPRLDGLRCVAVMMVMLEHFVYFLGHPISGGLYGVNLFFVLSGFLITSILLNDKSPRFGMAYTKFIWRRSLRIFPVYYFALLILLLIGARGIAADLPYLLSYTYNYRLGYTDNWNVLYSPYWSLCVEEQFYLFFPVIVLLLRKRLPLLIFAITILIIINYVQMAFKVLPITRYNYVGLLTNIGALSIGALGAILKQTSAMKRIISSSATIELMLIFLLGIMLTRQNWLLRLCSFSCINLFLVLKSAEASFRLRFLDALLCNALVIKIGRVSYGIYLYHLMVGYLFSKLVFDPIWNAIPFSSMGVFSKLYYNSWILKFPLSVILCVLVASFSYKYFEAPIMRLKSWYPRVAA